MMNISTDGILTLQKLEGLSLTPYKDQGEKWTIGYGHLIKPGEEYLMKGITDLQAHQLFVNDLVPFVARVNRLVTRNLNQKQFDALVIFDFNTGALHKTNLLSLINSGASTAEIFNQWTRHYITASGIHSPGLERRRQLEARMFFDDIPGYTEAPGKGGNLIITIATMLAIGYAITQINKS